MTEQARSIPAAAARPRAGGLSPTARRRIGAVVTHGILLLGLFIVFFPIYVTFVGSTLTVREVVGSMRFPCCPATTSPRITAMPWCAASA